MTGWDDRQRREPDSSPVTGVGADGDILEMDRGRITVLSHRPPLVAVILAAVTLLAGLAVGYAVGQRHVKNAVAAPRFPVTAPAAPGAAGAAGALGQTDRQCSVQIGHTLQLGVQVTNQSATGVTLRRVQAVLPLAGGLKATGQAWGPCGELLGANGGVPDTTLPPGGSTWFTVTFKVLVKCPGAFPVQFTLDYDQLGRAATVNLPGFADLGQVPYASCPLG
jgi:hypothetical protein